MGLHDLSEITQIDPWHRLRCKDYCPDPLGWLRHSEGQPPRLGPTSEWAFAKHSREVSETARAQAPCLWTSGPRLGDGPTRATGARPATRRPPSSSPSSAAAPLQAGLSLQVSPAGLWVALDQEVIMTQQASKAQRRARLGSRMGRLEMRLKEGVQDRLGPEPSPRSARGLLQKHTHTHEEANSERHQTPSVSPAEKVGCILEVGAGTQ